MAMAFPERRHILKSGEVILENESFPIHPYAGMSAIAMPHRAIGRSRAELSQANTTNQVSSISSDSRQRVSRQQRANGC